jgi:hypothetical protein
MRQWFQSEMPLAVWGFENSLWMKLYLRFWHKVDDTINSMTGWLWKSFYVFIKSFMMQANTMRWADLNMDRVCVCCVFAGVVEIDDELRWKL